LVNCKLISLCTGSTAFEAIDEYRNNSAFKHMLGIKNVPSAWNFSAVPQRIENSDGFSS